MNYIIHINNFIYIYTWIWIQVWFPCFSYFCCWCSLEIIFYLIRHSKESMMGGRLIRVKIWIVDYAQLATVPTFLSISTHIPFPYQQLQRTVGVHSDAPIFSPSTFLEELVFRVWLFYLFSCQRMSQYPCNLTILHGIWFKIFQTLLILFEFPSNWTRNSLNNEILLNFNRMLFHDLQVSACKNGFPTTRYQKILQLERTKWTSTRKL